VSRDDRNRTMDDLLALASGITNGRIRDCPVDDPHLNV